MKLTCENGFIVSGEFFWSFEESFKFLEYEISSYFIKIIIIL